MIIFVLRGIMLMLGLSTSLAWSADKEHLVIKRMADQAISAPLEASLSEHRVDICSNGRLAKQFIYDLGKARKINRLSWFFPQNRYASAVDYDIYAIGENQYALGQTIVLSQWTQIVTRRRNIMRTGRRESFKTLKARYILFRSLRSTNSQNKISIREFSVGYIPPQKPEHLTATYSGRQIKLQWTSLPNIDGYRLYRSDSARGKGFIITTSGPVTENNYIDRNIIPGKHYFYYVTAIKAHWQGSKSNIASVWTDDFTPVSKGWQTGISGRSMGRYGRIMLREARKDYLENVIGLTVLPDKKQNPQCIFTTLRSPKADKLTRASLYAGIRKNLYINEKLNLGSIVPCTSLTDWPQVDAAKANWVTRTVQFQYPNHIGVTLYETLTFPGLVMNLNCQSISLFRHSQVGTPLRFAYSSARGTVIATQQSGNILKSDMTEPWLLAWWKTVIKGKKTDIPMLLIFQHKPRKIYLNNAALNISFGSRSGGHLIIMPLYGIHKVNTVNWKKNLPPKVVQRARQWTRYSRAIPLTIEDYFKIDAKRDRVKIKYIYKDFLNIKDDWNTPAQKLCLLPSLVGLCHDFGYPVRFSTAIQSLDYPAEFGPLYGATDTTRIQYSIPGARFIINPGYRKKLADDPIVDKIRKLIPPDAINFFLTRPENKTWSTWRMRHISPALGKTLDLYNLYPDQMNRDKLKRYAENYVHAQQFYNSDTYYFYQDRVSGKTMNFSLGAEMTKGNPYHPPWISSIGDYLFGESTTLYALGKYYDFFNKKEELKKHWECLRYRLDGFVLQNDWEIPAPDHKTLIRGTSMSDFNNLFLSGYVAYTRMANRAGDIHASQLSQYLLARNMLLQFSHWKGQAYAWRHRPYFMNNTRGNGNMEPDRNQDVALLLRLREGYAWFMSSKFSSTDSVPYFILGVLNSYELSQFFNKYLHDEVAEYIYKNIPEIRHYNADLITHQEVIFRTLLYETDKNKILNLYKKISSCKDFPLAPYTYSALYYENPNRITPPPQKWINPDFEKRLHAFPEEAPWQILTDLSGYQRSWEIGLRDNSMKEFAIGDDPGLNWKALHLKTRREKINDMAQRDAFVFQVGRHQNADFCGLQEGSSTTLPSRPVFQNHPVHIAFDQKEINRRPVLLIDLVHLDPKSNTSLIINLNGVQRSVTLPMPSYMFWLMASEVPREIVSMEDREKIIAIPLPPAALKQGANQLTITAVGGVPVFYDWLGFGFQK